MAVSGPALSAHPAGVTESSLGGVSPGRDFLKSVRKHFSKRLPFPSSVEDSASWWDGCNFQLLTVSNDENGLIRRVVVEPGPTDTSICTPKSYSRTARRRLGTGKGLLLGDSCGRAVQIYGQPQSKMPSGNGNDTVESLSYNVGLIGTRLPLTMEILCSAADQRVIKISLAASKTRL